MKKRGFTLIELLAVIVMLAVIALIAVPVMLNVIERARKGAFMDAAYGVIDAVKLYYADASLDGKVGEEIFTFPEDTKLKLSGVKPKNGTVVLKEDGAVALAISNGTWCAIKSKEEERVTIVDYSIEECSIGNLVNPDTCFIVSADGSEIVGYKCADASIVIPSHINGIEIKKIGDNAFKGKGITHVTIQDGITSIGASAFENNQLVELEIPNSVTYIGDRAFATNQLSNIKLADNVVTIGNEAFINNQLKEVTIPNSVENIGDNAFKGNTSDMHVIVDKFSDSIEGSPWGANNAEWIGTCFVTSLQDRSEIINYICEDKEIEIPAEINGVKIKKIGTRALAGKELTKVTLTNNISDIGASAFIANKLTDITITSSVKKIGDQAFSMNKITRVDIANDVENMRIEEYAFNMNQIQSLTIPGGVTYIGVEAFFQNKISSLTISNGVEVIDTGAFTNACYQYTSIEVVIPSSVTKIGEYAFGGNSSIKKIIINKPKDSLSGSPWGTSATVEWTG